MNKTSISKQSPTGTHENKEISKLSATGTHEISKTAFGIGIVAIFESQVFPFMLSSAFTARTIVHEKAEVKSVKEDVLISVLISEGFSILLGCLLKDVGTIIFGSIFGILLMLIYEWRGSLIS